VKTYFAAIRAVGAAKALLTPRARRIMLVDFIDEI